MITTKEAKKAYEAGRNQALRAIENLKKNIELHRDDFYQGLAAHVIDWRFIGDINEIAQGIEDINAPFSE